MSGLVYAVIVLVWAAVLVPIWLRRHDDAVQSRSADRYSRAMRTLSRRSAKVGSRELVMPPRDFALATASAPAGRQGGPTVSVDLEPRAVPRREAPRRPPHRRPGSSARVGSASLARRRARTLLVLASVTIVLGLLAAVGVVPVWAAAPFAVLLAAFVVHLRFQAKRSKAMRRGSAGRRAEPPAPGAAMRSVAMRSVTAPQDSRPAPAADPATAHAEAPVPAGVESVDADDDEAWRPQSWPLPTYVNKPKAIRPVRVIDLTTPGAWTSGRLLDDEAEPTEEVLAAAEETTLELDAIVDRAVNN